MKIYTLKIDEARYNEIKKFYSPYIVSFKGEYVDFIAKINDIVVTGYLSKRSSKKITFSGDTAIEEYSRWTIVNEEEVETKKATSRSKTWVDVNEQIGSDEVGVGDFLGPMIVVATHIKKEDIKLLKSLGVKDSKKLSDAKIREIGEVLVKNIEYSKLTLTNEKYNAQIGSDNINALKAKMHNRALYNLVNKYPDVIGVYVDQFVSKEKYYEYLNDPEENVVRDISFMTKGESLYPSVAAASIIARYAFLLEMDNLNAKYKTTIPFGAGTKVNEFARDFIAKYGISEFNKIAKKNFANYKEVINLKLV
ncbi:MAG: ribonuclease HIII [Bacilli bacterium]|nr:ribonuclease HIII [Bacilli bacterium]